MFLEKNRGFFYEGNKASVTVTRDVLVVTVKVALPGRVRSDDLIERYLDGIVRREREAALRCNPPRWDWAQLITTGFHGCWYDKREFLQLVLGRQRPLFGRV